MSIFFKARSGRFSASVGILLIRIVVGSMFLFAGATKVIHLQNFIKSVQETGLMHDSLAFILAFILPFLELIFGALFIIGLFTPLASFVLSCLTVSFLFVLGVRHEELPFSYNFVILACTIATMFTGSGLISFDAIADRQKKTVTGPPVVPTAPPPHITDEVKSVSDEKVEVIHVDEKDVK